MRKIKFRRRFIDYSIKIKNKVIEMVLESLPKEKDLNFSDIDNIVLSDKLMQNSLSEAKTERIGYNVCLAEIKQIINKLK